MAEGLHDGHRERVLEDFLRNGFDSHTPPHKILEFLLFYCVPRRDTNELAHQLINRYGSVSGVLDAPVEELAKFNGLSLRGAALLKLIVPLSAVYNTEKAENISRFRSLGEIGKFMFERIRLFQDEKFAVLVLGADGSFRDFEILSTGNVNSVNVPIRDLMKLCLDKNGVIIAIAHNHPSGVAIPSNDDILLTERIADSLSHAGIRLIDHIITVSNDYVSMAQTPDYSYIFDTK